MGTPADWLIRSTHDRALPEGVKLWAAASEGEPIGEIAFTMGSRHGVKAREVRQHVWLRRIELPADQGQSVSATCLVACEFDAPAGVKPIEWRLLSNREATTLPQAAELIDWYGYMGGGRVRRSPGCPEFSRRQHRHLAVMTQSLRFCCALAFSSFSGRP